MIFAIHLLFEPVIVLNLMLAKWLFTVNHILFAMLAILSFGTFSIYILTFLLTIDDILGIGIAYDLLGRTYSLNNTYLYLIIDIMFKIVLANMGLSWTTVLASTIPAIIYITKMYGTILMSELYKYGYQG